MTNPDGFCSTRLPGRGALLSAAVVALLIAGLAAPASAQVATGRGRLQGIVMDLEEEPIEGARIVLTYVDTGESWEITTDKDGRWLKGNMGRGAWNIDIFADGYLPGGMSANVSEVNRMKPVLTYLQPGETPGSEESATGVFGSAVTEALTPGNAAYTARDFAGALAIFEQILATMPQEKNIHLVHVGAGNAAFEMGNYEAAMGHFEAALAVDDTLNEVRLGIAKIHMVSRDLDAAMAQLEMIDLTTVKDAIVFYNIGSLFFDQGQSAEAAKYYEMALGLNPNFADAHMQMGLCYIQQGMMTEAKPHLEKVIELAPETENAALAQDFLNMIG